MSKSFKNDLTGQRFGRLTVLEFVPRTCKGSYWKCKCDCGAERVIGASGLISGQTKSCGCLKVEAAKIIQSKFIKKHGKRGTRLYNIWFKIKQRCFNKNNPAFNDYGGRGIGVCEEWKNDFQSFYNWAMENGYNEGLSIDRIDNDGNYEPSNCRWTDNKTQCRNRRSNVIVEYKGKKMCLTEAAELSGISINTIYRRYYHKGDRGERLFRPVRKKN